MQRWLRFALAVCELGPLISFYLKVENQRTVKIIVHPHLLVRVTSERDSYQQGIFLRVGLASESHWLQPMLVLTVH